MNWQNIPADLPPPTVRPNVLFARSAVLNSWKEIAVYLGRGVRTVQRWERESALPVHRPKGKDRSAVLAIREELDQWLHHAPMKPNGNSNGNGAAGGVAPDGAPALLELARRLLAHAERLVELDHQNRAEAKELARKVDEIIRSQAPPHVAAGVAPVTLQPERPRGVSTDERRSPGSKPDKRRRRCARRSS